MRVENFTFLSSDGETNIHAVRWIPDDGQYKAILQITHGMVEYKERYEPFAEFLTQNGFMVVAHDHLGHGESVISKDDWGYMADENPSDTLVEDMHTLRRMVQSDNPDKDYFMLGHSMGSFLIRQYIELHGKGLSGVIIMGTGSQPEPAPVPGFRC